METILATDDFVGISFWLATAIMLASTVFFFVERADVARKWKTSLTVAGLVTGIAFWHYLYMRGVWIATDSSPTVYRYIDWLITVPLQLIEFYLILAAVTMVRGSLLANPDCLFGDAAGRLLRRDGRFERWSWFLHRHDWVGSYHLSDLLWRSS